MRFAAGSDPNFSGLGKIAALGIKVSRNCTYHGPGQVVAYPLLDLKRAGYFIKEYVYRLEEAVIRTLAHFGVTGHRVAGAPGIYVRLADPFSHAILEQRPKKVVRASELGSEPLRFAAGSHHCNTKWSRLLLIRTRFGGVIDGGKSLMRINR